MGKFTELSKTLFSFFGQLGYNVYMENLVPTGATFPYITIIYESNSTLGESTILQGRIWTKSTSRKTVNEISDKLYELIGEGDTLAINNGYGYIALYKGSPFIQPYVEDDETLQVNYFNIEMQIY